MIRLFVVLTTLLFASSTFAAEPAVVPPQQEMASTSAPRELKDLFYGEALYYAFQGEWFDSIARLDTELRQHHGLDEPQLDTLYPHIGQAEFAVGDFELAYRMHQRAGRAISAVIEGNVEDSVRNTAIYRLARLYFRQNQPVNALHAMERIEGTVPESISNDVEFLRGQILMANGRDEEAVPILKGLQGAKGYEGFASYNLGIALIRESKEQEGRQLLERNGQLDTDLPAGMAIRDKSNLVLGDKLLEDKKYSDAELVLERVRLTGPFSNRALLDSGWADAFQGNFEKALVPWSLLSKRQVTDLSVQQALLAVPYAYGKLGVYSKAAVLYGKALTAFGTEVDKLDASIKSIREGKFLKALVREELKQDANWVVKLRDLPETPETYYLLQLMASNDFQESLKNYLDLEELRRKMETWQGDLDAFEEMIQLRRAYYEPLLPEIDRHFRQLDSQLRLRQEQRDRIEKRLQLMLTSPSPEHLATAEEQIFKEEIISLEQELGKEGAHVPDEISARIKRLKGVLHWNITTDYDRRLTEAHQDLQELNQVMDQLKQQYDAYVRVRQAATQSYEGYDDVIKRQRHRIEASLQTVEVLMSRQGHILEEMAVNVLSGRRDRLAEYQIKARFAMADSYDRATGALGQEKVKQ